MEGMRLRSQIRTNRRTQPGAAPGSITADPSAPKPTISVIRYDAESFEETAVDTPAELAAHLVAGKNTWISVRGLGDAAVIQEIGNALNLHVLALEDVVNTHQRPKLETYPEYLFIVLRTAMAGGHSAQVTLFAAKTFVLSFEEQHGETLEPVRERLRKHRGAIRESDVDYLAYSLIDAVIDGYFPELDQMADRIEAAEDRVLAVADSNMIAVIHKLRHELLAVRRTVASTRELLNAMMRDPEGIISRATMPYLRDCYDHTVQIIDIVESQREIVSGLLDIHLSAVSNRMNQVMKVLTIIATMFIPLTFIAGLYGMNFDRMPELHWRYGYPLLLAVMAGILVFELALFWRLGWLTGEGAPPRRRRKKQR
jgi:magnesium transporter